MNSRPYRCRVAKSSKCDELDLMCSGFPPIREIRENLKTFSIQGKRGGFQPKSGEKISNQGTFFQTIFKPFKPINLRKIF